MAIDTSVWYKPLIGRRLKAPTRYLFEKWSGVSGKELIAHLHSIVRRLNTRGGEKHAHSRSYTDTHLA